jgi:polar amino acid transport system substrate-binding protein
MLKNYLLYFVIGLFSVKTFAEPQLTVVTEILPPMQYVVGGEMVGDATEIVKAVLEKSGLEAEFKILPWARAYKKVLSEKNTLIYSLHRTPQREEQFYWIGPVSQLNVALMTQSDRHDFRIDNIQDAQAYVVGAIRNSSPHQYLLSKGFSEDNNLFLFGTWEEEVNLFAKHKVDFVFGDHISMGQKLAELGYEPSFMKIILWESQLSKDMYLAANLHTDPLWLKKLSAAMEQVMQSSQYQLWYNANSGLTIPSSN